MDLEDRTAPRWSVIEACVTGLICLLLGFAVGYLLHAPGAAHAVATDASASSPPQATQAQITPEQLQQMADKQAEPLLAQVAKNGNNAELLAQVGNVYYDGHQFPKAIDYYERSSKIRPDANVLSDLGNAYYYSGDTDRALASFQRALDVDPKSANALFNIGMIEWRDRGDTKAAVFAWEKLLKRNPDHPQRAQVEKLIEQAKKHANMVAPAAAQASGESR